MLPSTLLALIFCGLFFMNSLITGIWKWRSMMSRPNHQAHIYVDTAHRASLLYSFACLVLVKFLEYSPYPEWLNVLSAGAPLLFFASAIVTYIRLGLSQETENQFSERNFRTTTGMVLLIAAELGGFAVLFTGFLYGQFYGEHL
jgi:hypothetical protein